jgi:hypothetical protein
MPDVPLLGQPKQEAAPDPQLIEAETAFIVFVAKDVNGVPHTLVTTDLNTAIVPAHVPSGDEMLSAVTIVASDLQAQKSAQQTIAAQQAMMKQAMEAQQNQQLLQGLRNGNGGRPT